MRNSNFLFKLISIWNCFSKKNKGKQIVLNNDLLVLVVTNWVSVFVINVACAEINAVNLNLNLVFCKELPTTVCNLLGVV